MKSYPSDSDRGSHKKSPKSQGRTGPSSRKRPVEDHHHPSKSKRISLELPRLANPSSSSKNIQIPATPRTLQRSLNWLEHICGKRDLDLEKESYPLPNQALDTMIAFLQETLIPNIYTNIMFVNIYGSYDIRAKTKHHIHNILKNKKVEIIYRMKFSNAGEKIIYSMIITNIKKTDDTRQVQIFIQSLLYGMKPIIEEKSMSIPYNIRLNNYNINVMNLAQRRQQNQRQQMQSQDHKPQSRGGAKKSD